MKNKVLKSLSIMLALALALSCFALTIMVMAQEQQNITYYIDSAGNDTTGSGTQESPLQSLKGVLSKATAEGYNVAGKTVTVRVGTTSTSVNMWGGGVLKADCDVVVIAETEKTRVHDTGGGIYFSGSGSLSFENIWMTSIRNAIIYFGNKDVSFDAGSQLTSNQGYIAIGEKNTNSTTTVPLNFELACESTAIYLCDPESNRTFKNVINITYDNAAKTQEFYFGCGRKDTATQTYYTKPVNFNIKNAKGITFAKANNGGYGGYEFKEDGLIQIINSSGAALSGLDSIVTANAQSSASIEQNDTPVTKWILTNQTTDYKDVVDFTETAGVYKVKAGYVVTAVKDDEAATVEAPTDEGDKLLDLRNIGAGEYTFVVSKYIPKEVTYYIDSAGNDTTGSGTQESPLQSLKGVLSKATAEGYNVAGKTVTVRVGTTSTSVNMWGGGVLKADCDVVVIAETEKTRVHDTGGGIYFSGSGSLSFENIWMTSIRNAIIYFGNKDVSFDAGSQLTSNQGYIAIGEKNTNSTTTVPLNFELACESTAIYLCDPESNRTFKNVINITYDNAAKTQEFYFGCGRKDTATQTYYTKPVNFNIKNAKGITFAKANNGGYGGYEFKEDGLIQIINSSGAALSGLDSIVTANAQSSASIEQNDTPVTKWILTNQTTDYKDVVDFTETAGVYKVKAGYVVTAVKDDEAATVEAPTDEGDKLLDLRNIGAGEYTFAVSKYIPKDVTIDEDESNNGYDIRDLVAVGMYIEDNNSVSINIAIADKDGDYDIDADDVAIIRWELLTGKTYALPKYVE